MDEKYYRDIIKGFEGSPDYKPPHVNGSLRFAYIDGNIHYLAIYVAQKEGYFEEIGLVPEKNLQFLKYRSRLAITNAFEHREIDAATLGTTPVLRYRMNSNGRIHIVSAVNSGGTSLVVKAGSDVDSIDDLNGKKIATPGFGSCQDVLMRKMFEGFEIKTV
ncbi:MAG: ABC transporter substrate-binding protein [Candidatus Methanoperedens sp.]|nr:ABC transporter substrate-binding protein [Candidatus Methanoperedens sp.]MCE8424216.1 ABC transporter substrate-binding protein [Candidatus Methanoperedens sp.]MCE8428802.1 ABC transporter substrate-binding protein [Candidatus Methanoperedens sp.]